MTQPKHANTDRKPAWDAPFRQWYVPAGGAALMGMAIALILRLYFAVPLAAEIASDAFTRILPVQVFAQLLVVFGHNAKHFLLAGMLLLSCVITAAGCVGVWEARRRLSAHVDRLPPYLKTILSATDETYPWYIQALPLAVILAVANYIVVGPSLAAQLPAGTSIVSAFAIGLAELLPAAAIAGSFTGLIQLLQAPVITTSPLFSESTRRSRRQWLIRGVQTLGVVAIGGIVWEVFQRGLLRPGPALQSNDLPARIVPPPTPVYTDFTLSPQQTPEVTAADSFYYVSKNLSTDPTIQADTWQLSITGKVQRPYTLSYAALQKLPSVERYQTLECISNDIGGPYISNGKFRGVRLADLLNTAGLLPEARELVFHAADGYSDDLHLAQALDPDALVVYLLDDAPLPQAHGFPARLLIPGLYGMKNGKWLTSLEMGTGGYNGYWEDRGWTREAVIKTMSRIDTPLDGDHIGARPTVIAGIAFAGNRGISRVDVTTDGGATWQAAQLRRPLGPLTWTLWQYPWTPSAGDHVIGVRAIDGQGYVQTQDSAPTLPDGASGYHVIQVTVA